VSDAPGARWIPFTPRSAARGVFLLLTLLPVRLDGTPREQSYGNLDTSFEFALTERRQAPLGVELKLVSTTAYPCAGYRILCSVQWSRDTLTVAILGLRRPSPCVPLASVASGSVFLGDLGDTTVVLRFTYRGHEDRYRIAFSRTGTRIAPLSRGFTSVRR
jgi:hypothetical protein